MQRVIQGHDRAQASLLPACLDDYVDADNLARVIEAYVEALDLGALGFAIVPASTGRPSYHPAVLLKLYITAISIVFSQVGDLSANVAADPLRGSGHGGSLRRSNGWERDLPGPAGNTSDRQD
jgi:hypothetical protein